MKNVTWLWLLPLGALLLGAVGTPAPQDARLRLPTPAELRRGISPAETQGYVSVELARPVAPASARPGAGREHFLDSIAWNTGARGGLAVDNTGQPMTVPAAPRTIILPRRDLTSPGDAAPVRNGWDRERPASWGWLADGVMAAENEVQARPRSRTDVGRSAAGSFRRGAWDDSSDDGSQPNE